MKKFFYSQKLAPYVFILPFVLTVIFFWAVPIANGVLLSFQDVLQDKWVGLDNYKRLLSDKIFLKALFNSTRYMIGTLVLLIPFPMLFATLLNSKLMKKPGFFKSIYFLPALTSVVVAGTIFRLMFGEMETSLANQVIGMFGLGPIKWLKNDLTVILHCYFWHAGDGQVLTSCISLPDYRVFQQIFMKRLLSMEQISGSSLQRFPFHF